MHYLRVQALAPCLSLSLSLSFTFRALPGLLYASVADAASFSRPAALFCKPAMKVVNEEEVESRETEQSGLSSEHKYPKLEKRATQCAVDYTL